MLPRRVSDAGHGGANLSRAGRARVTGSRRPERRRGHETYEDYEKMCIRWHFSGATVEKDENKEF